MDIQQDSTHIPQIEDFYAVIHNKLFEKFLQAMKDIFSCEPQMEFSRCTWEYGWNMKFKKRGRNLCTLYAREQYFTLLIVIGKKEAPYLEALLPHLGDAMQEIIQETAEGNGQRWLMIDVRMKAAYIRISGSCLPYVQAAMMLQSLNEKERHTKRHGFLEKIPCFFVSCSMR